MAEAAHRFGHGRVPGPSCVRSGLPVARHPHEDDAPIALTEDVVAEVELLQGARTKVLHDDVGLVDQFEEQFASAFAAEVEGDRTFVARVHRPQESVAIAFGLTPPAQRIGQAGCLDLDDVGAEVTHQAGAERPRDEGTEFEHPDTVESAGGRRTTAGGCARLFGRFRRCGWRHRSSVANGREPTPNGVRRRPPRVPLRA